MKTHSLTHRRKKPRLILASGSKRRQEILSMSGWHFETALSGVQESSSEDISDVQELVLKNASLKAASPSFLKEILAQDDSETFILGVDTVVTCGGKIFEKPETLTIAREMFRSYCSSPSRVHTGMALYVSHTKKLYTGYDQTKLQTREHLFANASEREEYFARIVSLDKSGGFSIEGLGAALFDKIEGSFYTVVGMPIHLVIELLHEAGESFTTFLV